MKSLSWSAAAQHVLEENGAAMNYRAILAKIVEKNLRAVEGKTPGYSLNAALHWSVLNQCPSPFIYLGKGRFILAKYQKTVPKP